MKVINKFKYNLNLFKKINNILINFKIFIYKLF